MEGVPYGACEPAEPPAVDPPPRRLLRRSWLWRASLLCSLAFSASALGRRALSQRSAAVALAPAALLRDAEVLRGSLTDGLRDACAAAERLAPNAAMEAEVGGVGERARRARR